MALLDSLLVLRLYPVLVNHDWIADHRGPSEKNVQSSLSRANLDLQMFLRRPQREMNRQSYFFVPPWGVDDARGDAQWMKIADMGDGWVVGNILNVDVVVTSTTWLTLHMLLWSFSVVGLGVRLVEVLKLIFFGNKKC